MQDMYDVHDMSQVYEISRQPIRLDLIHLLLDHPSRHLPDLLSRHRFPSLSAEQLQHPIFYDLIMAALHELDVQQAEQVGESTRARIYEKRIEDINKVHAEIMAAKEEELVAEKNKALDLKLRSAADKNHIAELTQKLAEISIKLLEATGPKVSVSLRTKEDEERGEELEKDIDLPVMQSVPRKGKHHNRAQKNKICLGEEE
ncbi:hypothetical protein P3342_007168 [Pyrenophora teres f. teres]|uniref:Uncharacterized protein n=1 Tax=Pyrenophora teres f. teres TaxID=97479 RepID=A0A6S6W1K2_9PLEO|nr:hypothetical protein HRS9139_05662 [Pyrenophora teres f. teres]KAE8840385.1 hypothetical protein PTNB85_03784 [Pyrenophora teres f. teres]KAE8863884.1 hypothetical protein PTNB29_03848 [Pyrenophora teres f. teres]KAE8866683.1 hypothetical protein PTNB73_04777 [Pyrenophora teres f. teres]KAK1913922.1 hypothetical protein P3342_007168 [Pyrenophora teres f. teres]